MKSEKGKTMSNERKRRASASAVNETAAENGAAPAPEPLAFEEALGRLDEMVSLLEEGQVSLEEALTLYEDGVRMAQRCQQMLDQAELRLQRLSVRRDGEDDESPQSSTFVLESFMLDEER